jgi:hypothetical protein
VELNATLLPSLVMAGIAMSPSPASAPPDVIVTEGGSDGALVEGVRYVNPFSSRFEPAQIA